MMWDFAYFHDQKNVNRHELAVSSLCTWDGLDTTSINRPLR